MDVGAIMVATSSRGRGFPKAPPTLRPSDKCCSRWSAHIFGPLVEGPSFWFGRDVNQRVLNKAISSPVSVIGWCSKIRGLRDFQNIFSATIRSVGVDSVDFPSEGACRNSVLWASAIRSILLRPSNCRILQQPIDGTRAPTPVCRSWAIISGQDLGWKAELGRRFVYFPAGVTDAYKFRMRGKH